MAIGCIGQKRGITLVDAVAGIAVVILLAAVLYLLRPSVSPARRQANQVVCLNHMKQIGLAIAMYSNKSYYGVPPAQGPMSMLYSNGEGILADSNTFHCPAVKSHHKMGDYLRGGTKDNWLIEKSNPNTIIAGDAEDNHNYESYIFLFKDGHAKAHRGDGSPGSAVSIDEVPGAYDVYDKSITENTDPNRSWLGFRD